MSANPGNLTPSDALRELQRQLERSGRRAKRTSLRTSCAPLDRLFGPRGLTRGSLVECISSGPGSGASVLALLTARAACSEQGVLVVVDRSGTFYPPAAAAWGIDLENTILVQPDDEKDEHWALDQALRCEQVAAVITWPKELTSHTYRRLQLAAEESGCVGLFVRPSSARNRPSWAHVQLQVSPCPLPLAPSPSPHWRLRVRVLRRRGHFSAAGEIELNINDQTGEIYETHPGNLAPRLARPAPGEHTA